MTTYLKVASHGTLYLPNCAKFKQESEIIESCDLIVVFYWNLWAQQLRRKERSLC